MKITVFTPTYNRAYIISKLYDSLKKQICKEFEWIIIDDGSTDNTESLVNDWLNEYNEFEIRYYRTTNGGKQRAINKAVYLAKYDYLFIVDSDDKLLPNSICSVIEWITPIDKDPGFAGVSGLRFNPQLSSYQSEASFGGKKYIDATNLERKTYNLTSDMAEVYKISVLKKYPFPVWKDETFTPECVVWDAIALDGYKIRWYNVPIYLCEYLDDGLTKGEYRLYAKNLMGCAMANNIKLKSADTLIEKYHLIIEILVSCFLKHDFSFIKNTAYPVCAYCLLPIGFVYSLRRKLILSKNL